MKCRFGGRSGRFYTKGADLLADVAAVDAIAGFGEGGAERFRDRPLQLDGEVGDAATGVQRVRSGDRAAGAGVDAARAGSAAAFRRKESAQVYGNWSKNLPRITVILATGGKTLEPYPCA